MIGPDEAREMARHVQDWCRIGIAILDDEVSVTKCGVHLLDQPQRKATGRDAAWRGRCRMALHLGAQVRGEALVFSSHEAFCDWAIWVLEVRERACEVLDGPDTLREK